jgi:hypothetical protein
VGFHQALARLSASAASSALELLRAIASSFLTLEIFLFIFHYRTPNSGVSQPSGFTPYLKQI